MKLTVVDFALQETDWRLPRATILSWLTPSSPTFLPADQVLDMTQVRAKLREAQEAISGLLHLL